MNLVQDTVCYCKGVGGGGNPAGRAQASGSSPVNKVIVEGLFTEQSGSVHRAECQQVRNGGARRRGLERDERNCLSCFRTVIRLSGLFFFSFLFSFFPKTVWQWAWSLAGKCALRKRRGKKRSRGLEWIFPACYLQAACAFVGKWWTRTSGLSGPPYSVHRGWPPQ